METHYRCRYFFPKAIDRAGNVFFTDGDFDAPRVRRIDAKTGMLETFLTPSDLRPPTTIDSDREPVTPASMIFDAKGNLVFTGEDDYVFEIRAGTKSMEVLAGARRGFKGDG